VLTPIYERSFERDLKKAKKRGLDIGKLKVVIADLISEKSLAEKHRNLQASGLGLVVI
jgi:mRNA-degrading endonuclease YafQ of YafQ-DinJ toxin-antitoxin module